MSLLAGVAVADITPPIGGPLAGFAARSSPSDRVNDPLSARAIAVSDGDTVSVVVALDLIAITVDQHRDWRRQAAQSAGVDESSVVLSVTHTHGGPTVTPHALGAEPDQSYLRSLGTRISEAVVDACARLQPASIAATAGRCSEVASNRRQPDGPTDPVVPVITILDSDGATMAVVFSYACHPVILGADNLAITSDWPGFARRSIEQALPGATAVYLQGCCGQLNTGHSAAASMTTAPQQNRTFDEAQRVGEQIAAQVLDARGDEHTREAVEVAVAERGVGIEFRPPGPDLAADVDAWRTELADADPARAAVLDMWLQWAASSPDSMPIRCDATVAAHRWGDAVLSFLPGEPFVEIGLAIRRATGVDDLLTAGYSGGVPGYVPYPAETYDAGGYEIEEAHRFYGQPGAVEPAVGRRLVAAAIETINAVSSPRAN